MRTSPATFRALGLSASLALVSAAIFIQACGTPAPDPTIATGGSVGATTGGSAATTGGTETGGNAATTGGTETGGSATGGTTTTTGGTSDGGTATGGAALGGATTGGTVSTTGGQPSGGGGSSGASGGNAGAAGANAGTGGGASGAGGSSGGGAGGAAATGGSGGGGAGGTGAGKIAVATLTPTSGNQITGTGTFTQTSQSVTLVIQVTNCPTGNHASHIHVNKNCGSNGDDAGAHWIPQGEVLPDIVCAADGTGTATVTPPNGTWTIGSGTGDVTTHALMVHTGDMTTPGGRIACGVINAQ